MPMFSTLEYASKRFKSASISAYRTPSTPETAPTMSNVAPHHSGPDRNQQKRRASGVTPSLIITPEQRGNVTAGRMGHGTDMLRLARFGPDAQR